MTEVWTFLASSSCSAASTLFNFWQLHKSAGKNAKQHKVNFRYFWSALKLERVIQIMISPAYIFTWWRDQRCSGLQNTIVPKRKSLSHLFPPAFMQILDPRRELTYWNSVSQSTFAPLQKKVDNLNHLLLHFCRDKQGKCQIKTWLSLSIYWSLRAHSPAENIKVINIWSSGSPTRQSPEEKVEGREDEAALPPQARSRFQNVHQVD